MSGQDWFIVTSINTTEHSSSDQYMSSASDGKFSVLESSIAHVCVSRHPVQLLWYGTGVAVLVWFSGALRKEPSDDENAKAGIVACALVYLAYSTLQGPSSVMIRPHPIVWKFVHGCAMLYLLGVVFLLMQGKAAARQFLKVLTTTSYLSTMSHYLLLHFQHPGYRSTCQHLSGDSWKQNSKEVHQCGLLKH
jgi:hypothetical protein